MLKKILVFLTFVALVYSATSCIRKPLYLQKDCILDVGITVETSALIYWKANWRDSLVYNWDEALYGKIGYSEPDSVTMVFIHNGRVETESKIKPNTRSSIHLDFNKGYKAVFYNQTETIDSYIDGSYYIESLGDYDYYASSSYIDDNYDTVEQPGEIFHLYVNNLYLSDDYSEYDEIYENGKTVYIYNIDAELRPISYIYIVQFIVINDDNTDIEAKMIKNFTISGISSKSDLFGAKTVYNGRKQISSTDIKPIQIMGDSVVFASRITILGRQPDMNDDGTWSEHKNNLYYTSMDVLTNSYGEVTGVKDITTQLNENPKGGIITVRILNSELKVGGTTGNGFGVDINEWNTHVFNIP